MGLLDQFFGQGADDPKSQAVMALASGLLSGNFGAGVKGYSDVLAHAPDVAMNRKLHQMQIDNYASEIEQRKAAVAKQQKLQDFMKQFVGGGQLAQPEQQPISGAMGSGFAGITLPGAQQRQAQSGGLAGRSIDEIATLKALGGPDLMDAYKWAKDPLKLEQGQTYIDRATGKERYMPKVDNGIVPDGKGGYVDAPGYAQSSANIKGAESGATERAKASFDPFTYTPKDQKNPILTTREAVVFPRSVASEPQMRAAATGDMGATPQQIQREIAQATADLKKTLDAPSREMLTSHIADMQRQLANVQSAPKGRGGIELQSPSEASQLMQDVQPTQQKLAGIDSARNAYDLIDKALKHPGLATATGLSGTLDPRNYIPGTEAKNYSAIQKQLQGNAFLSAYAALKGGGQITEIEGAKAENAIARLQTAQSTEEYKAALKDYQDVIGQGLKRMGVPVQGEKAQQATSFQAHGYKSQDEVLRDAQNTIMRNPSARAEVERRLQAMGLSLRSGASGSW